MINWKRTLRKNIDLFGRVRQFFLRGHSNWFALAFSMLNFTLIFYNLLFKELYFIPDALKHYSIFFIIFGVFYFPSATILGYLDFKKGTYKAEQEITLKYSPLWQQLFSKLEKLEQENMKLLQEVQRLQKK